MRSNNMLTQKAQVLDHFKPKKSITSWDAIVEYNATRLSAIILTLKEEGHNIISKKECGKGKWWVRYTYDKNLGGITNGE